MRGGAEMSALFTECISGWQDWARVYTSVDAFEPVVRAIYQKEGLVQPERLEGLTPGTNAVFRCGDTVAKVYAPVEAGFDSARDFAVETVMLRFAREVGVPASGLVAAGEIRDAYLFRYLILGYVQGCEAGNALQGCAAEERRAFALRMRGITDRLHVAVPGLLPALDLRKRAVENERLNALPGPLRADMRRRAAGLVWAETVIVHGDLTGENVLVDVSGESVVIDFADSHDAPAYYELPPLVFELFRCDREMVRAYAGGEDMGAFAGWLMDGLALHDFGADIVREYAKREGISLENIPSLDALGERLLAGW